MNLWRSFLRMKGWEVDIDPLPPSKCVICVAPHTSNWDFIYGLAAYRSLGRKANFLMKEAWFFFPMKYLFRSLGGIPVPKLKGSSLTERIIGCFNESSYMNLAITPEGTRSYADKWRKGFLYISYGADVPVYLGVIDYKNKRIIIRRKLEESGDADTDLGKVKEFYSRYRDAARYPEKFGV